MNKIYPNTPLHWPDETDAPLADGNEIEHAHVVLSGDRMSIRRRAASGAYESVDTLIEVSVKGTGKNTAVTGKSLFLIDRVGLDSDDSEVTVVFDGSPNLCLNC